VQLDAAGIPIAAAFRARSPSFLAGGPVELAFELRVRGTQSLAFYVAGDRAKLRPADFHFDAIMAGESLGDPRSAYPTLGGPARIVDVTRDQPFLQWIVLNEFVRLERAVDLIAPGESANVALKCGRRLMFASLDVVAVEGELNLALHRDDAALLRLVDELVDQVMHGPAVERERPLQLVTALRSPPAVERWRALLSHPDPAVAERVAQAL
jgi:hypothetical protein